MIMIIGIAIIIGMLFLPMVLEGYSPKDIKDYRVVKFTTTQRGSWYQAQMKSLITKKWVGISQYSMCEWADDTYRSEEKAWDAIRDMLEPAKVEVMTKDTPIID